MAGWMSPDREIIEWDGTIKAKKFVGEVVGNSDLWEVDGTETQLKTADEIDMQSKKIINLATPTATTDAVTKAYVDAVVLTDLSGGNHKTIYTNGSGNVVELALGSSGTVLTSQGASSAPIWDSISIPNQVAGSDTQVQFNDGGFVFGGDAGFTYNKTTDRATVVNLDVTTLIRSPHAQSTPARALNTTYQNTTGHPIIVYGSVESQWHDSNTTDNVAYIQCKTDASNPPTTVRMQSGTRLAGNIVTPNTICEQSFPFYMVVANNHYYRIDSTVVNSAWASVTLEYWNEVNF